MYFFLEKLFEQFKKCIQFHASTIATYCFIIIIHENKKLSEIRPLLVKIQRANGCLERFTILQYKDGFTLILIVRNFREK